MDPADVDELGFELDYDSLHGTVSVGDETMRLLAPSSSERERWLRCLEWVLGQRWPATQMPEETRPRAEMLVYTRSPGEQGMRRVYPDDDQVTLASARTQSPRSRGHTRTRSTSSGSRSRSRSRSRGQPRSGMMQAEPPRASAPQWFQHTQEGIQRTHPASSASQR